MLRLYHELYSNKRINAFTVIQLYDYWNSYRNNHLGAPEGLQSFLFWFNQNHHGVFFIIFHFDYHQVYNSSTCCWEIFELILEKCSAIKSGGFTDWKWSRCKIKKFFCRSWNLISQSRTVDRSEKFQSFAPGFPKNQ